MFFRISAFNRFLISMYLGISIFATACVTTAPTNTTVARPTCTSPTPETNPYTKIQPSKARDIYLNSFANLGSARQDALYQLGKNTEHWSDQVDIAVDDNNMVRITVTYLDPILVHYIVLNYLLNDADYAPNGIITPMSVDMFDYELDKTLKKLGERNEMLFIVTITSPFYKAQAYNSNVLTIRFPIKDMQLINGSDMRVGPAHEDHILDENIDITHGPVSGIVGYPIAVMNQEQCIWIVDQYTNTLTLDIPWIILGSTKLDSRFWNIQYRSLVRQDDGHPTPTFDPNLTQTPVSKLETPPIPNWTPNAPTDNTNWTLYWEDMGRYVWNLVITESHH